MSADAVPDNDHVARYVKPTHIDRGRVVGNAFTGRPGEASPSVHWMEVLAADLELQKIEVRAKNTLKPAAAAVFARLNVGGTRRFVRDEDPGRLEITFAKDPQSPPGHPIDDPSHALIEGLPNPDDSPEAERVGDLICQTIVGIFPAREPAAPPAPVAASTPATDTEA